MSEPKEEPKFNFQLKSDVIEFFICYEKDIKNFACMWNANPNYKIKVDVDNYLTRIKLKFLQENTISKYNEKNPKATFNTWIQKILTNEFMDEYNEQKKFIKNHPEHVPLSYLDEKDGDNEQLIEKINKKYGQITTHFDSEDQINERNRSHLKSIDQLLELINEENNIQHRFLLKLKFYQKDVPVWETIFSEDEIAFMLSNTVNNVNQEEELYQYLDGKIFIYKDDSSKTRTGLKNKDISILSGLASGSISTIANRWREKIKNNCKYSWISKYI